MSWIKNANFEILENHENDSTLVLFTSAELTRSPNVPIDVRFVSGRRGVLGSIWAAGRTQLLAGWLLFTPRLSWLLAGWTALVGCSDRLEANWNLSEGGSILLDWNDDCQDCCGGPILTLVLTRPPADKQSLHYHHMVDISVYLYQFV